MPQQALGEDRRPAGQPGDERQIGATQPPQVKRPERSKVWATCALVTLTEMAKLTYSCLHILI